MLAQMYETSAGLADRLHLPPDTGYSATLVGASIASAAVIAVTFSLLAVLVAWSVRRRTYADLEAATDEGWSTEGWSTDSSEDGMPM